MDKMLQDDKPITFKGLIDLLHKTSVKNISIGGRGVATSDEVDLLIANLKAKGKYCVGMERYNSIKNVALETWSCIISSSISYLACFDSDKLYSVTDKTTIDFTQMAKQKIAIFVTSSDINAAFEPMIQLMYREIVQKLFELSDTKYVKQGSMLPHHVRFILDDFASGTIMEGFERIIANCRSRNISFLLCIQSRTQLEGIYKGMTDTILDCINYKVYFSSANLNTQKYLSTITDKPLSEIQELGQNDICIEQIYCVPRFGRRFPMDRLMEKICNTQRKNIS